MNISVLAGMAVLILYGLADIFTAVVLKREEVMRVLLFGQTVGIIILLPVAVFLLPTISVNVFYYLLAVVTGVIATVAIFAFFKGIKVDRVSIVSPMSAAWPVITVPLAILFLSESLTLLEGIGALLIVLGAVFMALNFSKFKTAKLVDISKGMKYGLATLVGWGLLYYFVGLMTKRIGWFMPVFIFVSIEEIIFVLYFLFKKEKFTISKPAIAPTFLLSVFNTAAILVFGFGSEYGNVAVLSPLSAASPLLVVFLAVIFLKERLKLNEIIGVALLIVGTVLLAI